MSDENNIGMGEKATVTATRLVLLCSKAIEEYREALREQEYDETGPLTIIPSDFEIARDVVVEFFEERRKTPEPEENSGNAAALREVLVAFVDSIQWLCDGDERGMFKKQFAPLLSEARAALAAPARNVDRPECRTADEAVKAYRAETEPDRQNTDCYWPCIFDWLFAPASPQDKPKSCPS